MIPENSGVSIIVENDVENIKIYVNNSSSKSIFCGNYYRLEILFDDEWTKIDSDTAFTAIEHIIDSGEKKVINTINKKRMDKGSYRIFKIIELNGTEFEVMGSFEI